MVGIFIYKQIDKLLYQPNYQDMSMMQTEIVSPKKLRFKIMKMKNCIHMMHSVMNLKKTYHI